MSIFKKIQALFNKLVSWLTEKIADNDNLVKVAIPIAIKVLNIIKEANQNKIVDVLGVVAQSLGAKWGTKVATFVSNWITNNVDQILAGCHIAEKAAKATTVNEKLLLISQYISSLNLDPKSKKISDLSAELAKALDDSKLNLAEISAMATIIYKTE